MMINRINRALAAEKKVFLLLVGICMAVGAMAQLRPATGVANRNIADYTYFYVVPTSGVTSSSGVVGTAYGVVGGATKTIVPSDAISGWLMKKGYNVVSAINPNLTGKTLIVSYGYTGRRQLSLFSYASSVIIQMRDSQTQELVASLEAEGCGEDETDDILEAIYRALNLFQYYRNPKVGVEILTSMKLELRLRLTNQTSSTIRHITLRTKYYNEGELVYEQKDSFNKKLDSGEDTELTIKRDKPARDRKYQIRIEVEEYK